MFYSVNTASLEDSSELVAQLNAAGLETVDLTANDLSKDHVRFLAGGSAQVPNEQIYRLEFPERAGALRKFLDALEDKFDISLFHYKRFASLSSLSISPLLPGTIPVAVFRSIRLPPLTFFGLASLIVAAAPSRASCCSAFSFRPPRSRRRSRRS